MANRSCFKHLNVLEQGSSGASALRRSDFTLLTQRCFGTSALGRRGWSLELFSPDTAIPRDSQGPRLWTSLSFLECQFRPRSIVPENKIKTKHLYRVSAIGAPSKTKKSETRVFLLRISVFVLMMQGWNRMKGDAEMFYLNAPQSLESYRTLYYI